MVLIPSFLDHEFARICTNGSGRVIERMSATPG